MLTALHRTFGDPAEVLAPAESPTPEPGEGEVRIRTILSPIHNHDLWTVRGTYGYKPELPARAGTEAVGIVDALGADVEGLAVGQRVATGGSFGAWAEYVTTPAAGLIPVPDSVSDEAAAQLVAMPFSAISLLESLHLEAGDWLVQNAANGAVGRMVAQLAGARGVNVIGLVRRAEGVEELRSQGIERVVATSVDGWRDEVAALTGGAPIKVGVESVGGKSAGEVLSLLAENGELVVFGAMASPTLELSSGDVIFKQATVRGFWGSKVSQSIDAGLKQRLFGELLQHIGSGQLTLPVAGVFPFEQITDAVEASMTAGRVGKVLLRP